MPTTSLKPSHTLKIRRGYNIRELKEIIDYVKEIEAYGEIKGRKMWMDFERSGRTTRTWQSLKEVFLKRILPDLHNPYYKLTPEEISSFRVGYSMIKNKQKQLQKLQVVKTSPTKDQKKPVVINGQSQRNHKGEINRSESVETVVLNTNTCYETAEEIQNDLLSDNEKTTKTKSAEQSKSKKKIRDCIRYAEPLAPILQEIFKDFGSNDSTNESSDERETTNNKNENRNIKKDTKDTNVSKKNVTLRKETPSKKKSSNDVIKDDSNQQNEHDTPSGKSKSKTNKKKKTTCRVVIENMDDNIASLDSVLPNNQEAIEKRNFTTKLSQESINNINKTKPLKKRHIESIVDDVEDPSSSRKKTKPNLNKDSETNETTMDTESEASTSKDMVPQSRTVGKKTSFSKQNLEGIKTLVTIESHTKPQDSPSTSNPCLQSVSLYSKEVEKLVASDGSKKTTTNKVVLLGSSSEGDSNQCQHPNSISKSDTANTLCRIFGYPNERCTNNSRHRKRSYCGNSKKRESSSEWTSDSDSDFIEPPRSERRRSTRTYMKPGSSRIMALENNGGLLIRHNNKVYPIVSDGGGIRSFLKYKPMPVDQEFENEELFWKRKYVEEKKRTAELAKILEDEEDRHKKRKLSHNAGNETRQISNISEDDASVTAKGTVATTSKIERSNESNETKQEKPVKLTFVKDGQEMIIEGIWQTIQPILTEVMSMFQKDTKTTTAENTKPIDASHAATSSKPNKILSVEEQKELNTAQPVKSIEKDKEQSVQGTVSTNTGASVDHSAAENRHVDLEARSRVEEMEKEIFEEIKEKHELINKPESEIKVTNRRGRPRTVEDNKTKTATEKQTDLLNAKLPDPTLDTHLNTRSHSDIESPKNSKMPTRRPKSVQHVGEVPTEENEDDVRYKFPSPEHQPVNQQNQIPDNNSESILTLSRTRRQRQHGVKNMRQPSASQFSCLCDSDSWDSMQGYRDSDSSFVNMKRQRKPLITRRRHSTSTVYRRNHAQRRKPKQPNIFIESSSSNDIPVPLHSTSKDFRTESYDLLMQQRSISIHDRVETLENLEENSSRLEFNSGIQPLPIANLSPATQDVDHNLDDSFLNNRSRTSISDSNNIGSSQTSLPESPEISIVECITISQEVIDVNMSNDERINDDTITCTEKILRDISKILNEGHNHNCLISQKVPNTDEPRNVSQMSIDEQILTPKLVSKKQPPCPKIVIQEPNESRVLNDKLSKMILDSAKKVDEGKTEVPKATTSKSSSKRKRSSTPHKRSNSSSKGKVDTVIEEHMEYCAQNRGRNSCPPFGYSVLPCDSEREMESESALVIDEDQNVTKGNKKKREVIKVKIVRPRRKREKKSLSVTKGKRSSNEKSDTECSTFLNILNDSVDLIHNHSETCLHTTECVFDDDIVVNADRRNKCKSLVPAECSMVSRSGSDVSAECLCDDALDISLFSKTTKTSSPNDNQTEPSSPFDSPKDIHLASSLTSLMTEDLSEEPSPPAKPDWYLLSEDDELSNTQLERNTPKPSLPRISEYMNKLFPVTCTIPDLSTIVEISRETDENSNVNNSMKKE